MPQRTRQLAFGNVAATRGVLGTLGVAGIIDEVSGPGPGWAATVAGHLPAAGGVQPAGRPVFEAGTRGLVETTAAATTLESRAGEGLVTATGRPGVAGPASS